MSVKNLLHASIALGAGNTVVSRMDTHPGLRELKVWWGRWMLTANKTKLTLKIFLKIKL